MLKLLSRWREEAEKKGHKITRVTVAFEAGHDGFWLARRLAALGIEVHVIHASSVAVTREHRRAKTDRLDTEILKRGFLGWLRGERGHCKMVVVPTLAEEDAKRPSRERETLVGEASRIITRLKAAFVRLADARTGKHGRHALVGLLRQSVLGRLAGYEDVNDAERLRHDPAMRWIIGGKAAQGCAASRSQMGRFETQWLTGSDMRTSPR